MSGGPQNFLARLQRELSSYSLPRYRIINPHPHQLQQLKEKGVVKIGRLDGAVCYKTTPDNLFYMIKQRRGLDFPAIRALPFWLTRSLQTPLNTYLNRSSSALLKKADGIIFQSSISRAMHEHFVGRTKRPSTTIYNGVPLDVFYPQDKGVGLEGSPKLVITASFRLHKRLQDAIDLTNMLKTKFPRIRLHVIGDMDILTQNRIVSMDTSSCIFHGRVQSEELPAFYGSCDIGLALCIYDACPNSVLEMMACGLPVITNSQSGATELVGSEDLVVLDSFNLDSLELHNQETIPHIDTEKWADTVEKTMDNLPKLKEHALRIVKTRFDIKLVARNYAEFIQEVYDAKN